MIEVTAEKFKELMDVAALRPRVKREVRFAQAAATLSPDDWEQRELLAIPDRAGHKGVVLLKASDTQVFVASYELSRGITSSSGKAQPIICDFCRTWQTGSRSGSITIAKPGRDTGTIGFLCCADLQCSRHVRTLTEAAHTSRAQLREDMDTPARVARLETRIQEIAGLLGLSPLQ